MKRIFLLLTAISLFHITVTAQKKYEMVVEKNDGSETVFNVEDIARTYFRERSGSFDITYCPDGNHPHLIDLGLPSGTKWACCNVGATAPEDYGAYYAWGETQTKNNYSWSTYMYGNSYNNIVDIGSNISGTQYDVAHVSWGGAWHMPNYKEAVELLNNCTWEQGFTELNGVKGRKITGPSGNSIFFPFAGVFINNEIKWKGQICDFWISELWPDDNSSAYYIFNREKDEYYREEEGTRYVGYSVRPVAK